MKPTFLLLFLLLAASLIKTAQADTLGQWNFNSLPPDGATSTGTNLPSFGSGTASLVGGTEATWGLGSTNDPATQTDDSGWNTASYPGQGNNNKTAGVQFNVSTLGYSNVVVRWDQRVSSSASKYYRFQYSADGTTFNDYGAAIAAEVVSSSQAYYEAQTNNLAAVSVVNNNANFAFRIVSEFESTAAGGGTEGYVTAYGTNAYNPVGTVRFDLVTISGTPIPGANTPPTVSTLGNQTIRINQSTGPLPFTIGDAQDPPGNLTLNKQSSDQTVIANTSISFGGSGASRTVTVLAGSQTGTSIVTLYVIDTGGRSNSTSFAITILPLNTAPNISTFPLTNTALNTATAPIDFTVDDLETPAGSLTLSGSSANPTLLPNGNIVFGGSGTTRGLTLTPAAGQSGVAPVTIMVSDGTNMARATFPLMVLPSAEVIFYDSFSYPDGSLLTNSAFLWANRSGTAGETEVTNGQFQITAAQTEDVIGGLVGGPYVKDNGTVLYASFRIKALSLPKNTPAYFAHFEGGNANRGRVYAGLNGAGAGAFRLSVANGSDNTTMLASDLNLNTSYSVVTRYNIDSATTTLWLNPSAESDPGVTAFDSLSAVNISAYGFRQDSSLGAVLLVDDLRVGLSFAAVLPTARSIPLSAQRRPGQIILSWTDAAFGLQSAPTAAGVYTNIAGASSPFTNAIVGKAQFFRLSRNN